MTTLGRALSHVRVARGLGLVLFLALPISSAAAGFQRLGGLAGADMQFSKPSDISADGSVVVGRSLSSNGMEAFRWTAIGGMQGLGGLGGEPFVSGARAASVNGLVVVGISSSPLSGERTEAFRWTEAAGMVGLGDLAGGEYYSAASVVSEDGEIVFGTSTSFFSTFTGECFRWTEATGMHPIGALPGIPKPTCVANGSSRDSSVVAGWSSSAQGLQAFRWTESGGMIGLGDLPAGPFDSRANDVSGDGNVVVGSATNPGTTSFRWTLETGMVDLGRPEGASLSAAYAVSGDGSIVVGDAGISGDLVPTIWDASNGMRNLVDVLVELGLGPEFQGWDLEQATAISADGLVIAGWGYNPDGREEAWVVNLGPPSVVEIPTSSRSALALLATLVAIAALVFLRLN